MKRMLDKKLPKFIICSVIITGMILTSTPAFSRDGQSSNRNDRTNERSSSRDRDNYHDSDRSHNSYNSKDRDRYQDRDRSHDRYTSRRKNNSRSVTIIKKNDVIPAIIATGIIAGVTFSLLGNNNSPALQPAVPRTCPTGGGQFASAGSVTVTAQLLNIRSGPGMNKPCVGQIHRGATLSIMGSSTGWYYVMTSGGVSGWVMAQYTSPLASGISG